MRMNEVRKPGFDLTAWTLIESQISNCQRTSRDSELQALSAEWHISALATIRPEPAKDTSTHG